MTRFLGQDYFFSLKPAGLLLGRLSLIIVPTSLTMRARLEEKMQSLSSPNEGLKRFVFVVFSLVGPRSAQFLTFSLHVEKYRIFSQSSPGYIEFGKSFKSQRG